MTFKNMDIAPDLLSKVPIKIAWYYKFMPVKLENGVLTIALSRPLGIKIEDEIRERKKIYQK